MFGFFENAGGNASTKPLNKIIDDVKSIFLKLGLKDIDFYLSGGCVTGTLNKKKYDDIDIYFYDKVIADHVLEVVRTKLDTAKSTLASTNNIFKFNVCFSETQFAITFFLDGVKYQIINAFCGSPESLMDTYDLNCCMVSYTSDKKLIQHQEYTPKATVRYDYITCSTIHRLGKYICEKEFPTDDDNVLGLINLLVDGYEKIYEAFPGYEKPSTFTGSDLLKSLLVYNINPHVNFAISRVVHDKVANKDLSVRLEIFSLIYKSYLYTTNDDISDELRLWLLNEHYNTDSDLTSEKIRVKLSYRPNERDKIVIQKYPEYFL